MNFQFFPKYGRIQDEIALNQGKNCGLMVLEGFPHSSRHYVKISVRRVDQSSGEFFLGGHLDTNIPGYLSGNKNS